MQVLDGGPLEADVEPIVSQVWRLDRGGLTQPGADPERMDWDAVRKVAGQWAGGLKASGIGPGDRVAILADTSRDWVLADLAIHALGAVVVPIYPTFMADQVEFILADSGAKAVFIDENQKDKIGDTPAYVFGQHKLKGRFGKPVKVKLEDPSLLIYTSGTTGRPKGVLLSHENIAGDAAAAVIGAKLDEVKDPSLVAFLPLAHIAGYVSIQALTVIGGELTFSRPDRMNEDLTAVRPTVLLAVPRLWERIVRKVEDTVAEGPPVRQKLFGAARRAAVEMGQCKQDKRNPGLGLKVRHGLFEKLVYSSLRDKLGMDRTEVAVTGAAAIRPDLLWFLQGAGLPIIEGYGMTETSALNVCTRADDWKAGTVGYPLPGFKIALDDDGEILIGGIGVFQEYWGLKQETKETRVEMDGEWWVRSGDIGRIEDGRLKIVDRKKELEVLDTGKMIAPVRVEEILKSESPYVEDACLIGTDRKFAGMLIQPNYDRLIAWATENGIEVGDVIRLVDPTGEEHAYGVSDELLADSRVLGLFQEGIDKCNARVADFERVKAFRLVNHAFTVDRDELTPSFKKKRRNILANHKNIVEAMFAPRK